MKNLYKYIDFIKENVQQKEEQVETIVDTTKTQKVQIDENEKLRKKLNKIIDYTVIKPGTIKENIKESIDKAIEEGFYGICVSPEFVDYASYEIEDNELKTISTLGFPGDDMKDSEKLNEVIRIISDGADEIDMVIDIDYFKKAYEQDDEDMKNSSYMSLEKGIKKIADECHKNGVILKVVVESGLLSLEELKDICHIISNANADYIQTSTGMKEVGAELSKVKEMRRLLPDYIKIKAAGGIRSIEDANKFYPYVDRIGTSVILK